MWWRHDWLQPQNERVFSPSFQSWRILPVLWITDNSSMYRVCYLDHFETWITHWKEPGKNPWDWKVESLKLWIWNPWVWNELESCLFFFLQLKMFRNLKQGDCRSPILNNWRNIQAVNGRKVDKTSVSFHRPALVIPHFIPIALWKLATYAKARLKYCTSLALH